MDFPFLIIVIFRHTISLEMIIFIFCRDKMKLYFLFRLCCSAEQTKEKRF